MASDPFSVHFGTALLPDGWADGVRLRIASGTIAAIETDVAAAPDDRRGGIALPGLPNLHSHAFQRGMAGLAECRARGDDGFWTWREVMYRFVDRLDPDDLHAIAALAFVEMLERGFTRVGEFHYLHHDSDGRRFADPATMSGAILAAAAETGMALTHLPVFYAHAGFGGTAPGAGQRRFVHDPDGFARLLDAIRRQATDLPDTVVGVAPHSLRAVTPDELAALLPLAGPGPIHIHVAEQQREVDDCLAWSGARPVDWLIDHAPVDARWCLVHATHMTARETVSLARSGAVAGLCPITEANLGDGLFPAPGFVAAGGLYGIGSDSNVRIGAAEELRLLEYGQRLTGQARNVLAERAEGSTGGAMFRRALAGGARALGAASGLRVGLPADIVGLDATHPALVGRRGDALIDGWIFAAGDAAVIAVWRRGAQVVADGRHRAGEPIRARYRTVLERLLE